LSPPFWAGFQSRPSRRPFLPAGGPPRPSRPPPPPCPHARPARGRLEPPPPPWWALPISRSIPKPLSLPPCAPSRTSPSPARPRSRSGATLATRGKPLPSPPLLRPPSPARSALSPPLMGLGVCGSLYQGWFAPWGGVRYI
jgi:hypothetical protein